MLNPSVIYIRCCFVYCSQRALENNPLIVVKDMQFNVLQALIEFMYYGETRITEENLTSLVEAAKLFEVSILVPYCRAEPTYDLPIVNLFLIPGFPG